MTGRLSVVATPIGNLEDITFRAIRTLQEADIIACEDTRYSKRLLQHYEIKTPLSSFHKDNENRKVEVFLHQIQSGRHVALISDAGTPLISDPGWPLVTRCRQMDLPVEVVPGPSSVVAALSVAGLPAERFVFEGFLPHRKGRQRRLLALKEELRTSILFESPMRLQRTLEDLFSHMGDREIVILKELTKIHEAYFRGPLSKLITHFRAHPPKGEFVLLVKGEETRK